MRIQLAFLFLFLGTFFAKGQIEFSPTGAEWCYQLVPNDNRDLGYLHLVYTRDSSLFGQDFKIIEGEGFRVNPDRSIDSLFIDFWYYQRNDSIFYYGGSTGIRDEYLFKLNYEVGEITSTFLFNANFSVESVKTIQFQNLEVQKAEIKLVENGQIETTMYDIFGPNRGFVEGWWADVLLGDNFELIAYKDKNIPTINLKEGASCFGFFKPKPPTEPMDMEENEVITKPACPLLVFPNPTSTDLLVQLSEGISDLEASQILIIDNLGRQAFIPRASIASAGIRLDVTNLAPGFYILKINMACGSFTYSFIKIES